jgi:hypothetical protein
LKSGKTPASKTKLVFESEEVDSNKLASGNFNCQGNHYTIFITTTGQCSFQFTGYGYGTRGKNHKKNHKNTCLSSAYESVRIIMRKIKRDIVGHLPESDIEIPVYTEMRDSLDGLDEQLFRADPIYRNPDGTTSNRTDWAWFEWE